MRFHHITLVALAMGLATAATADTPALEKVKTGIHPDGGFYSLYSLRCDNDAVASIASFDGRSQWCTQQGDALVCSRNARAAWERACRSLELADTGAAPTQNALSADGDS